MTGKETLVELINLGIIHVLGTDNYFITDRANELFTPTEDASSITIPEKVNVSSFALYPESIREASLENKVKVTLDYCEVPAVIERNGSRFMVRSADALTRRSFIKIMQNTEYEPEILLKSIKDYYKNIDYPKAFKRYIADGDVFSMYKYYKEGNELGSSDKPSNQHLL